jgi:DNA-directed RNA polymerase subunit beta
MILAGQINKMRKNFGSRSSSHLDLDLADMQISSYMDHFLQFNTCVSDRKNSGLQAIFTSMFPIKDSANNIILDFIQYRFENCKYDVRECKARGISYVAHIKVLLRLKIFIYDENLKTNVEKCTKEQEVMLCDIPLMTDSGTFIINGVEKVVVAQMHRSPGVFFNSDESKLYNSLGKALYFGRVIPYRGSWLDFEFDSKDIMYFRIDKRRKLHVTTLLRALGMDWDEILSFYYSKIEYNLGAKGWETDFDPKNIRSHSVKKDLINPDTGEVFAQTGQRMTQWIASQMREKGNTRVLIDLEDLKGAYLGEKLVGHDGQVLLETGSQIDDAALSLIEQSGVKKIFTLLVDEERGPYIRDTLFADKNLDREMSLIAICRILRPGEFATADAGRSLIDSLFFDKDQYDLSTVGRIKLNSKLSLCIPEDTLVLTIEDIKHVIKVLAEARDGRAEVDDVDHLGVRRARTPGELVENQFRAGLLKVQKGVLERVSMLADLEASVPQEFINTRLLSSSLREFFNTSQLCQFMDQTNPLAEITHKRRLSALGPGGVNRERAGLEIRDVHTTHYGKICPIETPEGQNIGLISSLTTYARINSHGFIETPYKVVRNGRLTEEIVYLSALEEENSNIAQANVELGPQGELLEPFILCRCSGNFISVPAKDVHFVCLNNMQVVSIAAALIPFLENNDANRALMGSNMQRQAVPLLKSEAPFVGTGVEGLISRNSSTFLIAPRDGLIEYSDSERIVFSSYDANQEIKVEVHSLSKFERSNYNTCINQRPLVRAGQFVKKSDFLADGPSLDKGELALGRNVLIAFLPFKGYTFEDSIVISERLVKEDIFTSIRIEELELVVRDTRLGPEEITRDLLNVNEEHLSHLDEVGIVNIGARVASGDVLVGKVTPKSEALVTPEEKLLRAIFGEKAHDVSDSSLYVPSGIHGTVIDVRIFTRRGVEKDQRSLLLERQKTEKLLKDYDDESKITENFILKSLSILLEGQKIDRPINAFLSKESFVTAAFLKSIDSERWWDIALEDKEVAKKVLLLKEQRTKIRKELRTKLNDSIAKLQTGDELPQGALKIVKVFIATKCKLQPGDKMSGRHGNKGVISTIVPEEDMPFLEDGTVVDVVLNSLGIPSRMNIGQVLETHLGWASANLGKRFAEAVDSVADSKVDLVRSLVRDVYDDEIESSLSDQEIMSLAEQLRKGVHFATPVFDGAKIDDIKRMLAIAGVDVSGQSVLIDGSTGERLDRKVTVGFQYLLKLHHLVENKFHARSVGPYSLITQQPLGGKMHFGGQRLGEMECWALQAYGAAYTLQEMLTVKSDDVVGRTKMYESIAKGDHAFHCGVPESFNVMVKELQSLCLDVRLENRDDSANS